MFRFTVSLHNFFTARHHASAVYAVNVSSVCMSHPGIVAKWLNIGSREQRHTMAHGLWFSVSTNISLYLRNGA